MTPQLSISRVCMDFIQCMGIGFCAAALRCLFPLRRKAAAFWADFWCVGIAAILLQGFSAARSGAGELRWYMVLGAAVGAASGETVLFPVRAWVFSAASAPFRLFFRASVKPFIDWHKKHMNAKKNRTPRKKYHRNGEKELQNPKGILYNSNV